MWGLTLSVLLVCAWGPVFGYDGEKWRGEWGVDKRALRKGVDARLDRYFYVFVTVAHQDPTEYRDNNIHYDECGGTLIHPLFVLSAFHCFNSQYVHAIGATKADYRVVRGTSGRNELTILAEQLYKYDTISEYSNQTYDIAILKLVEPFYRTKILPLCRTTIYSEYVKAVGMGLMENEPGQSPKVLQEANFKILARGHQYCPRQQVKPWKQCMRGFEQRCTKKWFNTFGPQVVVNKLTKQICVCPGDSGGPVFAFDPYSGEASCLYGVIVARIPWSAEDERCIGTSEFDSIMYFQEWIDEVISETGVIVPPSKQFETGRILLNKLLSRTIEPYILFQTTGVPQRKIRPKRNG